MATKATTVKVRVAVFYNAKGRFVAAGDWTQGRCPTEEVLIANLSTICEDIDVDTAELPCTGLVDIVLPVPVLPRTHGKVLSVKVVKPAKPTEWGSVRQKL